MKIPCPACRSGSPIKSGLTRQNKQRYQCRDCRKRFLLDYTYNAYLPRTDKDIVLLTKEGLGIRGTARVLQISATTLLKRILAIAKGIPQPPISKEKTHEVDEICTFLKRKSRPIWIVYSLERESKTVASFNIGARTNRTLNVVLKTLHLAEAKRIFTDGLKNYKYLIAKAVHKVKRYATNRIERKNLSLKEKGMEIIAWCIMTNHVHLVFRSVNGQHSSLLLVDFKWFTSSFEGTTTSPLNCGATR